MNVFKNPWFELSIHTRQRVSDLFFSDDVDPPQRNKEEEPKYRLENMDDWYFRR